MRRNQRGRPWNRETKARLESAWESKWSLSTLIARHRQVLSARPNELVTRYMLANCLYEDGQREAAEAEWETVVQSEDTEWAETVREARAALARIQEDR